MSGGFIRWFSPKTRAVNFARGKPNASKALAELIDKYYYILYILTLSALFIYIYITYVLTTANFVFSIYMCC